MAFNSSRLPEDRSICLFRSYVSKNTSVHYHVTLTTCVFTVLLSPMAVVGNSLIMAAIWRNPSLRTPSYVLLACLAFTDFCSGLLSQPFFDVENVARLVGNSKVLCISNMITGSFAFFLSSLTGLVMTMTAVERWLHMSRRSLLTVHRVAILYIAFVVSIIPFVTCYMYSRQSKNSSVLRMVIIIFFLLAAALCFITTVFAYFKVFRIISQHQRQVQTNQNAIDIEKYRKSVFTILYIVVIFLLSYFPYVCAVLFAQIVGTGSELTFPAFNACAAVVFSSSFLNPLLYYWRIKEIRDILRTMARKLCCKENNVE